MGYDGVHMYKETSVPIIIMKQRGGCWTCVAEKLHDARDGDRSDASEDAN
jgi:hypothetical protein